MKKMHTENELLQAAHSDLAALLRQRERFGGSQDFDEINDALIKEQRDYIAAVTGRDLHQY